MLDHTTLLHTAFYQDKLLLLPYLFLALAIISVWIKRHIAVWGSLLILGIVSGFVTGRLLPLSLITIAVLGLGYYLSFYPGTPSNGRYHFLRVQFALLTAILSILVLFHLMPGFQNFEFAHQVRLSQDAIPYSLYFNFDKPLIGLFILAFGFQYINTVRFSIATLKKASPIILLALGIMPILALVTNYVRLEPKWNDLFYFWAIDNLIFTCVAEEAFFRGFIQNGLTRFLKDFRIVTIRFWGITVKKVYLSEISIGNQGLHSILALLIGSVLFGLAHFKGGTVYMILAGIAGLFYGMSYLLTRRIEASIATHFLVNATHILFFTYPALMPT